MTSLWFFYVGEPWLMSQRAVAYFNKFKVYEKLMHIHVYTRSQMVVFATFMSSWYDHEWHIFDGMVVKMWEIWKLLG